MEETYNIVKTVIIMMNFSRGGHEGNQVLHLSAAEATLPYLRAAGCHNYGFYVHNTKGRDPVMKKRKHGAFVRNIPGIYNSTWTDMFIETTYMRMWHGHTGAIGVATDYHHMAK